MNDNVSVVAEQPTQNQMKVLDENGVSPIDHGRMIQLAIEKGDLGIVEKMMDLQERHEKTQAKKAYVLAITEFSDRCPDIIKSKKGHNSSYAPLSTILDEIRPLLKECGLSHSWRTSQSGSATTVTCRITHTMGHSEETALTAEPDDSGSKNSIQAVGSTVSYLQRYTLKSLLGLAESDDDGKSAAPAEVKLLSKKQVLELDTIIADNEINKDAFLKHYGYETLSDIPAGNFASAKGVLLQKAKSSGAK